MHLPLCTSSKFRQIHQAHILKVQQEVRVHIFTSLVVVASDDEYGVVAPHRRSFVTKKGAASAVDSVSAFVSFTRQSINNWNVAASFQGPSSVNHVADVARDSSRNNRWLGERFPV